MVVRAWGAAVLRPYMTLQRVEWPTWRLELTSDGGKGWIRYGGGTGVGMVRRMGGSGRLGIGLVLALVLGAGGRGNCAAASWQGEAAQVNGQEGKTNQQGEVPEYSMGGVAVDTTTGRECRMRWWSCRFMGELARGSL